MSQKRKRQDTASQSHNTLVWFRFPTLVQWEILRFVVKITQDPDFLRTLQRVCKSWNSVLLDWTFWAPVFAEIKNQRQRLVPKGIGYLVQPNPLKHLNPIDLYATKKPIHGQWCSGFGAVIQSGVLYEGQFWGGLYHGPGILYEGASPRSPALRYQGNFKEHHLHCTDGDSEYLMGDGTVFKGNIKFKNNNYYCYGLFRYPDNHPEFPGQYWWVGLQITWIQLIFSGECYLGDVLENDRHGKGMILRPDRSIVYANFVHNKIHGQALEVEFPSGNTKTTVYQNGVPLIK